MRKTPSYAGAQEQDLPTPCLLLDLDTLKTNIRTLQAFVAKHGKRLRAHAKTHKCSRLAALQIEEGAMGICAAKVSEAQGLIASGIRDVLLTGPAVTPLAHEGILECARADKGFIATIDNLENATRLSELLVSQGRLLQCLLDLDVGFGRSGVPLENFMSFAAAARRLPGLKILGVQAYAGDVQHIADYEHRREANQKCLDAASSALRILRDSGFPDPILSVGGTGSHVFDCGHSDVTEIQAGSYALMDVQYRSIGSHENAERFDTFAPSLSLLTTVVSTNRKGFVTVDAGLKAVYRDGAIPEVIEPGLHYDWFGDEYGKVSGNLANPPLRLGDKLHLVVSHCDPTVNLFDQFFIMQSKKVVDVWPIDLRGCSW